MKCQHAELHTYTAARRTRPTEEGLTELAIVLLGVLNFRGVNFWRAYFFSEPGFFTDHKKEKVQVIMVF